MMNWTYLKAITFVLVLSGLATGGYIGYRFFAANVIENHLFRTGDAAPAPYQATKCVFTESGLEGSITTTSYFYRTHMRSDSVQVFKGERASFHTLANDLKDLYVWNDASDEGYIYPVDSFRNPQEFSSILSRNFDCVPWWSPANSVFVVPFSITFRPYSG